MKAAVALACAALAATAHGVDLGTLGPTYDIAEPHLLEVIQRQLQQKQRNGELQALMDDARSRGIRAVLSPAAVTGLEPALKGRTFYVDPSFTLDRNIVDTKGRLLFAAGTRKNPLEVISLSKRLLFFDARDARQVLYARHQMSNSDGRVKPILTGGSYIALMKAWRMPVYYDQQGVLTRRLGISQVPALVSQEGMRLRVDEVRLP